MDIFYLQYSDALNFALSRTFLKRGLRPFRKAASLDACKLTDYTSAMIRSFRHKGLRRFFEDDEASKLPADMLERIRTILSFLDAASKIEELDQPSFRLHPLKGRLRGLWAITVRANWRIVFGFEDGGAIDVDFMDYH
jgi:proteic killer suppression protein